VGNPFFPFSFPRTPPPITVLSCHTPEHPPRSFPEPVRGVAGGSPSTTGVLFPSFSLRFNVTLAEFTSAAGWRVGWFHFSASTVCTLLGVGFILSRRSSFYPFVRLRPTPPAAVLHEISGRLAEILSPAVSVLPRQVYVRVLSRNTRVSPRTAPVTDAPLSALAVISYQETLLRLPSPQMDIKTVRIPRRYRLDRDCSFLARTNPLFVPFKQVILTTSLLEVFLPVFGLSHPFVQDFI